ncbi:NDR1/HIN1-like protein 26 [Magnolia sinica]|uniref:NDR1/HIN1-like protein 26 n=1 Tax=Magnolia sinica TaxID=86752 RepID=UPI0026595B4A|nr:NDR1/HIN1-like protein 26 [Magnolia sinica]
MPSAPTQPHHHFRLRHPPRYYAHRVKESLTTRVMKVLCSCFLGLLLIVGIMAFVLWISLRPHRPRFHVSNFSIPTISSENGLQNTEISFNVTDRNPNQNVGIFYMDMDASVFYREKKIGMTPLSLPFYQPPKNTTYIDGVFSGTSLKVGNDSWSEIMVDREAGRIVFRLGLRARFRFKLSMWDSKRHRMHVSCDVAVGPDGEVLAISKKKRCSIYFS